MTVRIKYDVYKFGFILMVIICFYYFNQNRILEKKINEQNDHLKFFQNLSYQVNNERFRLAKFRFYNLSHLIIPFHIKQIKSLIFNIKKWSRYKPCNEEDYFNQNMPKLIFFVGYSQEKSVKNLYYDLSDLLPYFRCFSNRYSIDIIKIKLYKNSDNHILGARLMFEHMLARRNLLLKNASYIFYMEPDSRPIREYWLNALQNEISMNSFWMKGSIFRGIYEMNINKYLPNKYHINGNAIYNIGDKNFANFYFKQLRPYIERHNDSITAYDTDFSEYLFDIENYDHVRTIIHNFALTETILNLWLQNYSVKDIRRKHPKTYIVHGGNPIGF